MTRAGFNRALLNATGNGVLAVDPEGVILLSNRVAKEQFGAHPGARLLEAVPELWPDAEKTAGDRVPRAGILVQRGKFTYLAQVNAIVVGEALEGVLCVFIDGTELESTARRMRSFQELAGEQDAIINLSSEGLWICDGNANVLRINPASERLNRIRGDQVVGKNMRDLLREGLFDRSATLEVLRTRAVVHLLQEVAGKKLVVTGSPVFDEGGNLIRVVVNERDVTEIEALQRQLEEQEAIKDQFRVQLLEMQNLEIESRRVIAKSPSMLKVLRQALKVSTVDSSVLILGETGAGKGLIADLIHKYSNRAGKPLLKINCGAMADEGTLFLDEIAELPLSSQVKLLRFLEDGHVMRVGGARDLKMDVRILAATNRNLEIMVEKGEFRLDLYYRLNVIPIHVPPVRERKECILPLLRHYIDSFAGKHGVRKKLSRAASDALLAYPYPGNVRELVNLCERLVVMTDTESIDLMDLPRDVVRRPEGGGLPGGGWPGQVTLKEALESVERSLLLEGRERYGNQMRMAAALGINQSTIARKLKRYGIA
ncbi:MAG: Fis family transcriptional regulator [Deltaproteobacteria bacterium 37-65-8]|nr:MAG: Fis family transcriptional regulator [Deltaproteobacteria bacterium 37-65-8]